MGLNIAIVGATGLVGKKILQVLEERNFPVDKIFLYASGTGRKTESFRNKRIKVNSIETSQIPKTHVAFFSAGSKIPLKFAGKFVKKGATVIDNSTAFREDGKIPLIIPEINPGAIRKKDKIIANPNCSTIIMLLPVYPIYRKWGIRRIIASTYQSVSGAGREALLDLDKMRKPPHFFSVPIDRNIIPHIGKPLVTGFSSEERKMRIESQKILSDTRIKISTTCVRIPVRFAHSVSVTMELKNSFTIAQVKKAINSFDGVVVYDNPKKSKFPYPLLAQDRDEVFAGRIRRSNVFKNGLSMWIVGDNIRKGAATNAVQIAELLSERNQGD